MTICKPCSWPTRWGCQRFSSIPWPASSPPRFRPTRPGPDVPSPSSELARSDRYAQRFRKLKLMPGVGTLSAMVFLTEIGDLDRFANRRQLAAYLGLAPAAHGSGNTNDRKGRITRQGPARVRHVLCQAAWAALRCSEWWKDQFNKVKRGSPKRAKVAIVAIMRRLAIAMWHTARSPEIDRLIEEWTPQSACLSP